MTNRLVQESSPYLQQHAENPVDWYPWGAEALERAAREDKPVFLSIGYAACHWCHVMEEESFEDPDTAAYLNEHFISIKVDREERPDLDDIYMQAVVGMTGRGGWPMSVWLTPEGQPFLGGTYYPDSPRMGMPSFRQVLEFVVAKWEGERDRIQHTADQLTTYLREESPAAADTADVPSATLSAQAAADLNSYFDARNGGWGRAPKFPQAMAIDFLLHRYARTGDESALAMAESSLLSMANGGVYDQLGGGFHRYSVDAHWLVPHFEKMLYDNALLARTYLHAFGLTDREEYRAVVREVLDYVLREMTHEDGGFFSTQDADSEGEEGRFFVWGREELTTVLSRSGADVNPDLVADFYGASTEGNFEGANVLHAPLDIDDVAERHGISADAAGEQIDRARRLLWQHREERVKPARDEKVLAGWNGLMLAAFAEAGRFLQDERYLSTARRNADFLLGELRRGDGRMLRTWRDGTAKLNGYLEDHAAVAEGLLALYQATFEERWYLAARDLADEIIGHFGAPDGGFYDTSDDHEALVARPRSLQDNAIPSGGSLATTALLRLGALTGDGRYRKAAEAALASAGGAMDSQSVMFGQWLVALELAVAEQVEVAVVGERSSGAWREMVARLHASYRPFVTAAAGDSGGDHAVPLLEAREPDGPAAAWVCRRGTCAAPVRSAAELASLLE